MRTAYFQLLVCAFLISCNSSVEKRNEISEKQLVDLNERLIEANKLIVRKELHLIDSFIREQNLLGVKTGSGLFIMHYKIGSAKSVNQGDELELQLKIESLDGKVYFPTQNESNKKIKIGSGENEKGLEEALLTMNEGDSAMLILPSHLAFGLHGVEGEIPGASPLIYRVGINQINKSQ
ncbi:MAG: hypothetical protein DWQ44_07060 [Bacteroidetes bacterium]|nr:MAG: hypothetical protein DWQ33_12630 [Bacteroidota bacterium]REJ99775.1 MAG: hypothetical protein DWQ39_12680 [Bacteroidota bacterium]REK34148.1 MAG: hypothetical protein DWQ44_07060 [Bacteroidota bacterium]REK50478.1 MAG: hypothetical protein DWQ48_03970 [Bacteroidota bacterium]